MTRLIHSNAGFIRSLQMSRARFFAFVEGRLDRVFFDRLLEQECCSREIGYQVFAMKELPGATGGKSVLLSNFQDFRGRGLLKTTAFGKTMACVFVADKDSDDFCGRQLRSPHLIYSPSYDLEAHLFNCGDLQRALADSCGITLEQARSLIPDPRAWLIGAARAWKDWIALCLICQCRRVNCGCTFDRQSAINPEPFGPPNAMELEAFKVKLTAALCISRAEFDDLYSTTSERVEASLRANEPMRFFKGKWLSHLIQSFLSSRPRPADANFNGVGERLTLTLVAQVGNNAHCCCCAPYAHKVRTLLASTLPVATET